MSMGLATLTVGPMVLFVCASFLAPFGARAQQEVKAYRIGFLRAGRPPETFGAALQQGLRERGYIVGQNAAIEYRLTAGSFDELPGLVEELVRLNVDVIVASAGPAALAAQKVTKSVPIVFVGVNGPEEVGLVSNLARPGGNITGLALTAADLGGKRLELLREVVPKLTRVAILYRPENRGAQVQLKEAEAVARAMRIELQSLPVSGPDDFEPAFKATRGVDGLLQVDDPLFVAHRTRVAKVAAKNRLPAIFGFKEFAESGGLMSYGADLPDLYRRAATYVDKILKGTKPADLPVEQPTKFELVINLKAAKQIGLTIPPSVLARADKVIK
jgi:putative ABC transport system substrate-binding protein